MCSTLCQNYSGRLFNCCRYSIVNAEEWSKLTQFYEVDYPIIMKKTDEDYTTNPGEYKYYCCIRLWHLLRIRYRLRAIISAMLLLNILLCKFDISHFSIFFLFIIRDTLLSNAFFRRVKYNISSLMVMIRDNLRSTIAFSDISYIQIEGERIYIYARESLREFPTPPLSPSLT